MAAIAGVVALGAAQAPPPPDTILVNGHVITVDRGVLDRAGGRDPDGRFTAVGTDAADPEARRPVDDDRSICAAGRSFRASPTTTCTTPAADPASICPARDRSPTCSRRLRARVAQSRPGDVIITNSDWHEAQLKEHRLPYRTDLDTVLARQSGRRRARRSRVHPQLRGARRSGTSRRRRRSCPAAASRATPTAS